MKEKKKQYYIPSPLTKDAIRDFEINAEDINWRYIGNKLVPVLLMPVSEEEYKMIMKPIWREDKRAQRHGHAVSLDKLYDENEYETADKFEVDKIVEKKLLIAELKKALNELEETDRRILEMFMDNKSDTEIANKLNIGIKRRAVNARKHKIFEELKERLKEFI